MKNIYLYIENQNNYKIIEAPFRVDTPNQTISNIAYVEIKKEIEKYGYNFDFLVSSNIEKEDILIVVNLQIFSRGIFLKIFIKLKKIFIRIFTNKQFKEVKIRAWKEMAREGRLIPYLWESKAIQKQNWNYKKHKYFSKILTWDNSYQDNKKYFACDLQAGPLYVDKKIINTSQKPEIRNIFLSAISHNKITFNEGELYTFRYELFNWLGNNHSNTFKLYGGGWNVDPEYVGENPYSMKNYILYKKLLKKFNKLDGIKKIYVGITDDKNKILQKSKFSLCIENSGNSQGYLTEKFFDCVKAGSIPVYLGALNISDLVPENIFVDIRKFNNNFSLLYKYLLDLDNKNILELQENGYNFLRNSNLINKYLPQNIAKQIVTAIEK